MDILIVFSVSKLKKIDLPGPKQITKTFTAFAGLLIWEGYFNENTLCQIF